MTKKATLLYLLKNVLLILLFSVALYYENAQQQRLLLLICVFVLLLSNGIIRGFLKRENICIFFSFFLDIAFIFILEFNSRLLLNYFFHSFYIIILLEAALTLNLKKGITFGAAAVLVSMIKYGYLIYYKTTFANVSQMAFFLIVNVLILIIAAFAQLNREERERKDILYQELLETHKQLKQYTDKVNRLSILGERNRIARDIHDSLGHNMTALIMQLQMAECLMKEDPKRTEELIGSSIKAAKDSLSGIREVVETLRGEDTELDQSNAIKILIKEFSEKTGAKIKLEIKDSEQMNKESTEQKALRAAAGNALYRIIQESITNAVRHGQATKITVNIDQRKERISFFIRDNGSGAGSVTEGFGLKGMRERAEAFGGRIEYGSEDGFYVKGILNLEEKND